MLYGAPVLLTAQVPEVDKKRETWALLGEGIQSGYMSYTLNSLRGVIYIYIHVYIGSIKGEARSSDCSSYRDNGKENGHYYFIILYTLGYSRGKRGAVKNLNQIILSCVDVK